MTIVTEDEDMLEELRTAVDRLDEAEAEADRVRDTLAEILRRLHGQGVKVEPTMVAETGYSRGYIYTLMGPSRPPRRSRRAATRRRPS